MSKRTKACEIPQRVKYRVWERDGHRCIFCGSYKASPEAHIVSRAHGGLGIEKNIVTVCRRCHDRMDNSIHRPEMIQAAKEYVIRYYGSWSEDECTYKRWSLR